MNELAKKTLEALRKTDETFLNYVVVPMPSNETFDILAEHIHIPDNFVLKMDDSPKAHRCRELAQKQTELVLNTISKIKGKPITSKSYGYIKPSIMTDEGFGFAQPQVLASIDVTALPSIDEAAAYHSDYDFKSLIQNALDEWSAINKHDVNAPFINWSRHTIGFYLSLLLRCEKSQGVLISEEELITMLGYELNQAM